jgi:tRNA threonylcarbamoyladenosine biosynthesis protein TsaE
MSSKFCIKADNLEKTDEIAKVLVSSLTTGTLLCMYGDIGAGKTTLTKSIGKYLEIKEKITSPSFVILNEYHSGKFDLYHFDLYRLEEEGVATIIDELIEYSEDPNALTIVEWAQFDQDELLGDRLSLEIKYFDDETREFCFEAFGDEQIALLSRIKEALK